MNGLIQQPKTSRLWLLLVCAMTVTAAVPGGFAQDGTSDASASQAGGNETEDNDAYPDAAEVVVPTNTPVIDAADGAVVEWTDIGANLTDIEVRGVAASTDGFHLFDPSGYLVFANQPSRSDGVVE